MVTLLQKCSLLNTATSKLMDFGIEQITVIIILLLGICLLTARFSSKYFVLLFIKWTANRIPHDLNDITESYL